MCDGSRVFFADNMRLVARYKANRSSRQEGTQGTQGREQYPEVAEVAAPVVESVEVPSDEEYLSLTSSRGRGRPSRQLPPRLRHTRLHNIGNSFTGLPVSMPQNWLIHLVLMGRISTVGAGTVAYRAGAGCIVKITRQVRLCPLQTIFNKCLTR